MKKLALGLGVAALALSTTAMAANTGWYAGGQLGWNKYYNTSASGSSLSLKAKSTSGVGYGVHAGYNFMKYFGLQLGFQKYSDLTYKTTTSNATAVTGKYYDISLMAMGYYNLSNTMDLFGGVGMAYVKEKESVSGSSKTQNFYRPKLAVGLGYNLDQNWNVNLSYSYIFGKGKLKDVTSSSNLDKYSPAITMLALGVDYSF